MEKSSNRIGQDNDGGHAFPAGTLEDYYEGMTLRDYFAGELAAGVMSDHDRGIAIGKVSVQRGITFKLAFAEYVYDMAQAMVDEKLRRDAQ